MKRIENNVLAEGEVTGHFHQATGDEAEVFGLDDGSRLLNAPRGAVVTHQEHGPLTLPAGEYVVRTVVEVDPFSEEIRAVRD